MKAQQLQVLYLPLLRAASSVSPLLATLTENTRGGDTPSRRALQSSVQTPRLSTFPPLFRPRPAFVPFLRTNLISTLLSKACATRINVPIVRFRGSFSIAEILGAKINLNYPLPQSSQSNPFTLPNSFAFAVTSVIFRASACPAIKRSYVPMGFPLRSKVFRISPA